jgi:hypothetical protein
MRQNPHFRCIVKNGTFVKVTVEGYIWVGAVSRRKLRALRIGCITRQMLLLTFVEYLSLSNTYANRLPYAARVHRVVIHPWLKHLWLKLFSMNVLFLLFQHDIL